AHDLGRLLTDLLLHLTEAGEDLLAAAEQPLTGGRRRDLAGAAAEQPLLVPGLQSAGLLAHPPPGDVVQLGGAREGAGLDHVAEHLERLELHEAPSFEGSLVLASVGSWCNSS